MAITRWTDDRLDDLATLVKVNDTRLDHTQELVADHEKNFRAMGSRTRDRFQEKLILWTIGGGFLLNAITSVILFLIGRK